jgi:hypothetical protein
VSAAAAFVLVLLIVLFVFWLAVWAPGSLEPPRTIPIVPGATERSR